MSPPGSPEDEFFWDFFVRAEDAFDCKCRTVEVGVGEETANCEFFPHNNPAFRAYDEKFAYAGGGTSDERAEVDDVTEVLTETVGDKGGCFLLRKLNCPAVEVGSLTVVAVEHLGEDTAVGGVAKGGG